MKISSQDPIAQRIESEFVRQYQVDSTKVIAWQRGGDWFVSHSKGLRQVDRYAVGMMDQDITFVPSLP